jgi:hypothetical protein
MNASLDSARVRREYARVRAISAAWHLAMTRPRAWRSFNVGPTRCAAFAWDLARARVEFERLERQKLVRLVQEGDDVRTAIDLSDEYVEPARDAHPETVKAWNRRMRALDRDGVWYYRVDVLDPATGRWEHVDGVGGVIGDLDDAGEYTLKDAALNARRRLLDAYHSAMAEELAGRATYAMA